jgi:hypothetical protein
MANKIVLQKQGLGRFGILILMLVFGTVGAFFVSRSFAASREVHFANSCRDGSGYTCGGNTVRDGSLRVRNLYSGQAWWFNPGVFSSGGRRLATVCYRARAVGGESIARITRPDRTSIRLRIYPGDYRNYCYNGYFNMEGHGLSITVEPRQPDIRVFTGTATKR